MNSTLVEQNLSKIIVTNTQRNSKNLIEPSSSDTIATSTNLSPHLFNLNNVDEWPTFNVANDLSSYSKIATDTCQESRQLKSIT